MTRVSGPSEPPASPKSRHLQALAIALADADVPALLRLVTTDVRWQPVGRKAVTGVDAFLRTVTRYGPATALTIDTIVSEGGAGAVSGTLTYGRKRRAFCLVCGFADGDQMMIRSIVSWTQPLTSSSSRSSSKSPSP